MNYRACYAHLKIAFGAALIFAASSTSFAQNSGPQGIILQGRLTRPDSSAVTASSVDFILQIRSPGSENCILYEESHTVNMSGTDGVFSLRLGTGTRTGSNYKDTSSLKQVFSNTSTAVSSLNCVSGSSYTPNSTDARRLRISFDEGGGLETLAQDQTISSVPYALYADSLQGKSAADFVSTITALEATPGTTQTRVNRVFDTDYSVLDTLLNGTSTLYAKSTPTSAVDYNGQRIINVADPTGAQDVATKNYSDTKIGAKAIDLSGIGSGVGDGKILAWDATNNKWVASTANLIAIGTSAGQAMGADAVPHCTSVQKLEMSAGPTYAWSCVADGSQWIANANGTDIGYTGGYVGIGTTAPGIPLYIKAGTGGGSAPSWSGTFGYDPFTIENGDHNNINLITPNNKIAGLIMSDDVRARGQLLYNHTDDSMRIATAGTERIRIDSAGNVGIGTTAPMATLHSEYASTATSGFDTPSGLFETTPAPTGAAAAAYTGANGTVLINTTNTSGSTGSGTQGLIRTTGTGSLNVGYGVLANIQNLGSGTINKGYGGRFAIAVAGTGSITEAYGLAATQPTVSGGGSIGTYYGIYVQAPTAATKNFSFYSEGGTNYFGGNVGIGTTAPGSTFHVMNGSSGGTSGSGTFTVESSGSTYVQLLSIPTATAQIRFGDSTNSGRGNITYTHPTDRMGFFTAGVHRMSIDSSGNVGIGTTAPGYPLDVQATAGRISVSSSSTANPALIRAVNGLAPAIFGIESATGGTTFSNSAPLATIVGSSNATNFQIATNTSVRMTVTTTGDVGIGTTAPAHKLDVDGDIGVTSGHKLYVNTTAVCDSTGCTASPSDRRYKTNILPLEDSFSKIMTIQGVSYDWLDQAKFGTQHQIGFIAQDLEKIYPEVVKTDEKTGFKSVMYDKLVAPLIEAFKTMAVRLKSVEGEIEDQDRVIASVRAETDAKTARLESENQKLKAENAEIKARLEKIEKMLK